MHYLYSRAEPAAQAHADSPPAPLTGEAPGGGELPESRELPESGELPEALEPLKPLGFLGPPELLELPNPP